MDGVRRKTGISNLRKELNILPFSFAVEINSVILF